MDSRVTVYYYDHNCNWITKYCEEYHTRSAYVPISVLNQYTKRPYEEEQ